MVGETASPRADVQAAAAHDSEQENAGMLVELATPL